MHINRQAPFGGQGAAILQICWTFYAVATVLLLLRVYSRYRVGRHGGASLAWALVSWVFGFVAQIFLTVSVYIGTGKLEEPNPIPSALMCTWIALYLTFISIGIAKIAVVSFLLEIQAGTHRRQSQILWFIGISNIVLDVLFVLYLTFRCSPASAVWNINNPAECHDNFALGRGLGYFVGAYNAASDLILSLYPAVLFSRLNVPTRMKVGLSLLMSIGVLSAGCGAVKTWELRHVTDTTDLTFDIFCILVWTFVEMWMVLITSSIPPLWPLFRPAISKFSFRSAYSTEQSGVSDKYGLLAKSSGSAEKSMMQSRASNATSTWNATTVSSPLPSKRPSVKTVATEAVPTLDRSGSQFHHPLRSNAVKSEDAQSVMTNESCEMELPDGGIMIRTNISVSHEERRASEIEEEQDQATHLTSVNRDGEDWAKLFEGPKPDGSNGVGRSASRTRGTVTV